MTTTSLYLRLLYISALFALICGCNKNPGKGVNPGNSKTPFDPFSIMTIWDDTTSDYDDYVNLWATQWYNYQNNSITTKAMGLGDFTRPNLGYLKLNNHYFNYDTLGYNNVYAIASLSGTQISNWYGAVDTLSSMGGTVYTGFSETMYVPELFSSMSITGITNRVVQKSTGFSVSWSTDNNNTESIFLLVYSTTNPSRYFYAFEDDDAGSYSFSSSNLASFDSTDIVHLTVARGNEHHFTNSSRVISFRGGTELTTQSFEIH